MSIQSDKELKDKVLEFITSQPGYDSKKMEKISITNDSAWIILYGDSIQTGIAGTGATPEAAYNDFLIKWTAFNGFNWLNTMNTITT